jgi:replicative DNA helicase
MTEEQNTRVPPQNLDAEKALLGALLTNSRTLEKVSSFLKPQHFALAVHGRIFDIIQKLNDSGRIADITILKEHMKDDASLQEMGGDSYLTSLVTSATSIINAADYGKQIFDRYMRRQLIAFGTDIVNDAYTLSLENDAIKQIESAEQTLYELADKGETEGGLVPLNAGLKETLQLAERAISDPSSISGLPTGLLDIDKLIGGLHNSDLIILAGRPAMGKSALATCIAFNIAKKLEEENKKNKEKKSVAFFSLEMSTEQLATRILSTYTHIKGSDIHQGKLNQENFDEMAGALEYLNNLPLYIDDTAGITVNSIKTRARRFKRDKDKGLALIVIDYLQLISGSGRSENRVQELSEITRSLKLLAKELNVPVLVLSQLSRMVEMRDNKRPQLSDLRESGSIEQDADIVMFVYREIYYLEHEIPQQRINETQDKFQLRIQEWEQKKVDIAKKAEAIIAKHRHGSTGTANLYFNGEFTEFGNLEEEKKD